ncbi:EPS depolymerase [Erwinia phage vB_EamP-L1]|uniref:Probable tail spike protein n=1 Tax=Erwinia phage vB_EamP-L1 TaxID=1051673 RepID=G0YQ83_9CAUD|nr:EPS depolymerase [Erwinia phage vB_EamP-L1]AEJ81510.1 EPS depolymerase [Erwinia phage vB_EamP-L1]
MADQSTIVEIPLTSATRAVTIPFDYLTRSAVVLTIKQVDDVTFEKTLRLTDDYRFTGLTEVTLNGDYSSFGDLLEVKRHTPATRLVDFRDGSVLTANSLNISQLQAIHIAEEGRFEITTEIREATADAQRFAQAAAASAGESKTYRDSTQKIWDGILDSIQAAGDKGTLGYLATPAGFSAIGGYISFDALRLAKPQFEGQRVKLESYIAGKYLGGGEFVGHLTTAPDNGGTIASGPTHHWKRTDDNGSLNVTHFGAVMDGVTDDMHAVIKMHNWSRSIDATFGPGIVLPSGKIALSPYDFGDAEIPAFKMKGPTVSYGRLPSVMIIPFNKTSMAYMFRFKARRMDVSFIYVNGAGSKCGFLENTVTRGDYCRIHAVQARGMTGRVFHVFDTIDTAVTQCYSSQGKASFFRTDWSNENPGAWDHPTAIKITDCNFEGHTGEYAVSCIRAGQSVMEDVWFDHCDQGFDISQGGWLLKNVTQENSKLPSGAQYAKVIQIKCRFAQGAGLSPGVSGYDPAQDPSGSMPSWVNSVYERGTANWDQLGFINTGSMSYGYESSQYKMSNMTGNAVWYEIGTLGFSGAVGVSCDIELVGTGHFDSAVADARPQGTNFGGGKSVIRVQQKDSNTKMAASWYGEQASPISDVRIVLGNKNRPRIFVQLRGYTGGVATTFHTNDKSNFEGGQHFYLSPVFAAIDIATVPTAVQVPAHWSVNNSAFGLGYNMTDGQLMLEGKTSNQAASEYLPIKMNGLDKVIALQPLVGSVRTPRYTLAELPRATEHPYGVVLVSDAVSGNGTTTWRMAFSTGSFWFTADGANNLGAGSVSSQG